MTFLEDLLELFKPAWKCRNRPIRIAAVKNLTNQRRLAIVAQTDEWSEVLMAAAERLTDQKLAAETYKKIALKYHDSSLGTIKAALEKVSSETLAAVVENPRVRRPQDCRSDEVARRMGKLQEQAKKAALEKLSDQRLLVPIAKSGKIAEALRIAAVDKLTDQMVLAEIAQGRDNSFSLRFAAAVKLADQDLAQSLFAEFVKSDKVPIEVREAAVEKLTDRELVQSVGGKIKQERTEFDRRIERERQARELDWRATLQWEREERCHHDYEWDPVGYCDFCKSLTHTGKCRLCGHELRHICT